MQTYLTGKAIDELVNCKPNEWKVFIAMVKIARHNVVDLLRYYDKVTNSCKLGDKSIETAITGLRKKGILVRTQLPKVWFIDPLYIMKGSHVKIFSVAKMIEDRNSCKILERIREWEEETMEKESRLNVGVLNV